MTAIVLDIILALCLLSAFVSAANPTKVTPKPSTAVAVTYVLIGVAVIVLWCWVAGRLGYWQIAAIVVVPFLVRVASAMGRDDK